MKIFQICSKSPYPPREGGPIAMNNITQGLLDAGHLVKVLAINTPKYFIKPDEIPETYSKSTGFESIYVETDIKAHKAFVNLFSKRSYNVDRFISRKFDDKIKQILSNNDFDIVQLESIYVAPYIDTIRKYSNAKIVLRAHNIEHIIWQQTADNCNNPVKRFYLKYLTVKLKNFEKEVFNKVDGIAAISHVDAGFIIPQNDKIKVVSIPVGIDSGKINEDYKEREFPGIFHLGSMDWIPNQEGIRWFLKNVWSVLIESYNEIPFYLAGRNIPEWLQKIKMPGVIIQGEVNDAYEYMKSKSIMIVPLLAGSGIRVKILEGMACGNTIISTSIGANGISCTDGKNILIADTPEAFIGQIIKCVENPAMCTEIGKAAKKLIAEEYDNQRIINNLIEFYKEL